MKTITTLNLNNKKVKPQYKNLVSGMLFGVLLSLVLVAIVGCGRNDNNGAGVIGGPGAFPGGFPPGGMFPGGGGFGGGPLIGAALGNAPAQGMQLALQFQAASVAPSQPSFASGQALAFGELFVLQPTQCLGFGGFIAPGQYMVQSMQPGFFNNGLIQNMQLVAMGPGGQIQMAISVASILPSAPKNISCNGMQMFDELAGSIMIQAVNGMPCNMGVYVQTLGVPNVCFPQAW
jgi:hypothetical protein